MADPEKHSPRILIVRRDNIGDLVCTTPLIDALRARFPVPALRTVLKEEGGALNRGLGQTARLQILYSVLLTLGLW